MSRKNISDKQVVLAVSEYQQHRDRFPYEILCEQTGEPEKVCYRAMERACDNGYLDYGVSLRTSWLTEKGKQLLGEGDE